MTDTMKSYAAAMLATLKGVDLLTNDAIACDCLARMTEEQTRVADLFVRACFANA